MSCRWFQVGYGAAHEYYGPESSAFNYAGIYPHRGEGSKTMFEAKIFTPYQHAYFDTTAEAKAWVEAIVALEFGE